MANKSCILLCIIVLVSSLLITSDALPTMLTLKRLQKRSGLRLCGKMLVEALAAICQSEYYAPSHIKRNNYAAYDSENFPSWDRMYPDGLEDPQAGYEFFSANQLTRRGIADECCTKSCSIGQLASYCGPNPGK